MINPGFSSNAVINWYTVNAQTLANHVKNDLKSSFFNQKCVKVTTVRPTASILSSVSKAICIRKGQSSAGEPDYHLMKLTSNGWLHKPGQTAVLRHKLTLSPATTWLCEATLEGSYWMRFDMDYTGSIYYLTYKAEHSYSLDYTGENYHSGAFHYYQKAYVCSHCGDSYGAYYERIPCGGSPHITPNGIGDNTHDH